MFFHIVKKGDTLSKISQLYNIPLKRLIEDNNLDEPYTLLIGQCLMIRLENFSYLVQKGDSLDSLSKKFHLSIDRIIANNNLTKNQNLSVGQKIFFDYANKDKEEMIVNGYCYESLSDTILKKDFPSLTFIAPFAYRVTTEGGLSSFNPERILNLSYDYPTQPMMVIANIKEKGGFSTELAHTILNDSKLQDKLLEKVDDLMDRLQYKILNIDFEYIDPADKVKYTSFVRKAKQTLSLSTRLVSVALAPKDRADKKGLLYEAHDYRVLGNIVDYVIIMTYEWGYTYGEPQAIAPINLIKNVIDYAKKEIDPSKILMGIPNYGYDWTLPYEKGRAAKSLSNKQAINLAIKQKADIQFSKTSQTPFFEYTDQGIKHVVHFDDPCSYQEKLELAIKEKIGGISIWTLTTYNPQLNLLINYNYDVTKI